VKTTENHCISAHFIFKTSKRSPSNYQKNRTFLYGKENRKACLFLRKLHLCHPCPNDIEQITDLKLKKIAQNYYKSNIRKVISILKGNSKKILDSFSRELRKLSTEKDYESAIVMRSKILILTTLLERRSFEHIDSFHFNNSKEALNQLQNLLKPFYPSIANLHRIECYDISNLSFKEATASMVVLVNGLMRKISTAVLKIKNISKNSDFDMMEEAITRRFKNKWEHPDLIVLDGGKPQLQKIQKVLRTVSISIPVIGIAKNPDRLVIPNDTYTSLRLSSHNKGLQLIQMLRDESHRFAKKYHLFLRRKSML
jgi:excinuclease ABC subunit C